MMYRITMNGSDIYGPTVEQTVIEPHLDIELNSAGTLEFTLPVDNGMWGVPRVFQDDVEVYEDGKVIFFGRPLQITRDWNNQKKIVCEGALAFFNDSIQRTNEILLSQHRSLEWFFRDLVAKHNAQVDDFPTVGSISPKHFEVGTVSIPNKDKYVYRKTDYQTTLECLQQMCLDTDGGYFITRREYDDQGNYTNYIDWVETMPIYADQPVQFGVNLLDITQDLNGADICTVLMPLGNDNCTLSNYRAWDPDAEGNMYPGVGHTAHSDEIYYQPGLELYGRVVQHKTWSDYSEGNEQGLWMKAADWLKKKNEYIPTIEVDAADLHYIDKYKDQGEPMYGVFQLGMEVEVISPPHGLTEEDPNEEHPTLIIYKLNLDLDSGVKKITIGTPPKKELTDILAPSGSSKRKSGGDGDDYVEHVSRVYPVTDIMVKTSADGEYISTKQNGKSYLNLSGLIGGGVEDVQVDDVSIVDENGIANLDSSEFGTTVVANPSDTATDDLTTIQIGDTVYDIPGGGGGERYRQELIYDTPVSAAGNITVSNFGDADSLTFVIGIYASGSYQTFFNEVPMTDFKAGNIAFIGGTLTQTSGTTWSKYAAVKYVNDTTISIVDIDGHYWGETGYIYRIYKNIYATSVIYLPTIYSEEEREVGVDTDGRPLYQRTYKISVDHTSTASYYLQSYAHGISNLNLDSVRFEASIIANSGTVRPLVFNYGTDDYGSAVWNGNVFADNTYILFELGRQIRANTDRIVVTLRYTKTTDTPGSGTWTPDGSQAHHYSLNEHIVGTWIDGNTLWEKTWDLVEVNFPNNSWTAILNNLNIGHIVSHEGLQDSNASVCFDVWLDGTTLKAKSLRTENEYLRYLTLQYTKSS